MGNGAPGRSGRVVVTGIGVISGIGIGRAGFLDGLLAGRGSAAPVTAFDVTGFEYGKVCEVPEFAVDEERPHYGRATQMIAAAALMAVEDAGMALTRLRAGRGLIAVGTTEGEARDVDEMTTTEVNKGLADLDPVLARRARLGRMPVSVADDLGLEDVELVTLPDVCAAGNYAIGYGLDALRAGEVSYALVGGADSPCRKSFAAFYRLGALARDECRPFAVDRTGVVLGEGSAMLLLEPLESALERGALIHAEVLDYNFNCDAGHPTRPSEERVTQCLRGALDNAGVSPAEVDLVMAHGTATKANDPMEAAAFTEVFGDLPVPPVAAIKSMIGHTMGGAAAHSGIAAILGLEHGFLPPTINHTTTDPECPVDCVPNRARRAEPKIALVNSLGFGGLNAAVVLKRFDRQAEGIGS
ncbi:beta-ketoacyl-[acyl-carrier-protein] synthase family protein [Amycolatopsis magusensis]|uniref:3-oxoacyl-[acyl-carrier-protein] synthase II n=1 Tax=Amycolatopsis magusensis TaxID=882444 RepID=A0ABS4PXL4_9PSEU|nr:beta-ketoacyl-[acyl-carrier-protein] synthase family protein [Amycolatopsis magusensis]MBP2184171.1 3-oxoacyl-[acyl-carrier-protein] synthase II [Amycolatopsis magusensis]MDI5981363.1 beta-ketoacyl-[acyl-carrier-protein] synthase family protein [Amycolatopsis magusensis]